MKKHMIRFFPLLLALIMVFSIAFSEGLNLEEYDDEALLALKQAVDKEYFSREGSEAYSILPGQYTIGTDIKAGKYYIAKLKPSSASLSWFSIYEDREEIFHKALELSQTAMVDLFDGDILKISDNGLYIKSTMFTEEELYHYETPEGTYVPKGIYYVGEGLDLSPGIYTFSTPSIEGCSVKIYKSKEKFNAEKAHESIKIFVTTKGNSETRQLDEGYVLEVTEHYSGAVILNMGQPIKEQLLEPQPQPATQPTSKPSNSVTTPSKPSNSGTTPSKPSDSGYNFTTEEYARLIRKGIEGTLTPSEAALLERYYQHYK